MPDPQLQIEQLPTTWVVILLVLERLVDRVLAHFQRQSQGGRLGRLEDDVAELRGEKRARGDGK
jgi:hypothetical protein